MVNEIDQNFLTVTDLGLFCSKGGFYLDPVKPVGIAIISHAHGDHAIAGNNKVFATSETIEIMKFRHSLKHKTVFDHKKYNEQFQIEDVLITFHSANHIAGSAQVLMVCDGIKYLYTGDYKLQKDTTCSDFELVLCDVLITESTFANPEISHPDPVESILQLNKVPFNIILGAYSLGKAQRLTKLITENCPKKNILIHHSISPLHKIYESFGVNIGLWQFYDRKLMKNGDGNYIYIVPPITFNSYLNSKNAVRIFASGWQNLQNKDGIKLFISDHADWNDIIWLISESKAKEVWTIHGNGEELKKHFENKLPSVRLLISA